jgi:hypothetical protein
LQTSWARPYSTRFVALRSPICCQPTVSVRLAVSQLAPKSYSCSIWHELCRIPNQSGKDWPMDRLFTRQVSSSSVGSMDIFSTAKISDRNEVNTPLSGVDPTKTGCDEFAFVQGLIYDSDLLPFPPLPDGRCQVAPTSWFLGLVKRPWSL